MPLVSFCLTHQCFTTCLDNLFFPFLSFDEAHGISPSHFKTLYNLLHSLLWLIYKPFIFCFFVALSIHLFRTFINDQVPFFQVAPVDTEKCLPLSHSCANTNYFNLLPFKKEILPTKTFKWNFPIF